MRATGRPACLLWLLCTGKATQRGSCMEGLVADVGAAGELPQGNAQMGAMVSTRRVYRNIVYGTMNIPVLTTDQQVGNVRGRGTLPLCRSVWECDLAANKTCCHCTHATTQLCWLPQPGLIMQVSTQVSVGKSRMLHGPTPHSTQNVMQHVGAHRRGQVAHCWGCLDAVVVRALLLCIYTIYYTMYIYTV